MAETKEAIAQLFYSGKLKETEGEFIGCSYGIGFLVLPLLFICYLLPFTLLVIVFLVSVIDDPESFAEFFEQITSLDVGSALVIISLILFIIVFTAGLFFTGLPELKLVFRSLKEAQYQRQSQRYRYGLLLTEEHLAIRCFSQINEPSNIYITGRRMQDFADEPIIFAKSEIVEFFLKRERRVSYVMMHFLDYHGYIQRLRLPVSYLDSPLRQLFRLLQQWHR